MNYLYVLDISRIVRSDLGDSKLSWKKTGCHHWMVTPTWEKPWKNWLRSGTWPLSSWIYPWIAWKCLEKWWCSSSFFLCLPDGNTKKKDCGTPGNPGLRFWPMNLQEEAACMFVLANIHKAGDEMWGGLPQSYPAWVRHITDTAEMLKVGLWHGFGSKLSTPNNWMVNTLTCYPLVI